MCVIVSDKEREEEKEVFPIEMATLLVVSEVRFGSSSRKSFQTNEEKDDKQVRKERKTEGERERERVTVSYCGWPGCALQSTWGFSRLRFYNFLLLASLLLFIHWPVGVRSLPPFPSRWLKSTRSMSPRDPWSTERVSPAGCCEDVV